MSSYSSKHGSDSRDSRRHASHSSSRRESDSDRHRHRSASPERNRSKDKSGIPESFGRAADNSDRDDDLNILERMKVSYIGTPLEFLHDSVIDEKPVKVWTRNYKEVRGICSGLVVAFDKHWNLIMGVIDEVYLKPRKSKTPFLRDIALDEDIPEMKPKVPRKKKTPEELAAIKAKEAEAAKLREASGKPKRKKKKKGPITQKRHMNKIFVRGDNIVMIAPADDEEDQDEEEEEEEAT